MAQTPSEPSGSGQSQEGGEVAKQCLAPALFEVVLTLPVPGAANGTATSLSWVELQPPPVPHQNLI